MAKINPCGITEAGSNTGFECGKYLGVPSPILTPGNAKWAASEMDEMTDFLIARAHAALSQRFFPLNMEVLNFEVTKEADVVETFPNGTSRVIRLGGYTLTWTFKGDEGGECMAKTLFSFLNRGYRPLLIDKTNQYKSRVNSDGTRSGIRGTVTPMTPDLQTYANGFANKVSFNVTPDEFITNTIIEKSDTDIFDIGGLLDVEITQAAAATTTKLKIGVKTECAETDLVASIGAPLADPDNFIVKNAAGTVVSITAAAIAGGLIELTGTFTSGQKYTVSGSPAATWLANDIIGYEVTKPVEILIP